MCLSKLLFILFYGKKFELESKYLTIEEYTGDMFPTTVSIHFVWSAILFLCFYAVYRKYQENQISMLRNFYMFFLVWSTGFFGLLSAMLAVGYLQDSSMILTLGYVIPHFFAFISVGYLWRVQSSINFPKYEKLFYAFVAYGLVITIYGLSELPEVVVEDGSLVLGPESTFSMLIPLGMAISAVLIAGSSFYSAYRTSGEARKKLSLIGTGTVFALVLSAFFKNMGYSVTGEITNVVWVSLFVIVVYWSEFKSRIIDKLKGE